VLSSLALDVGPSSGGAAVNISGNNLTGADSVTFDGIPGDIIYNDPSSIVVVTPAGSPGVASVVVTTVGGASNDLPYTYILPPSVNDVLPDNGPTNGGNTVTFTGSSFTYLSNVYFDSTPATSFTIDSDTSATAVVPAGPEGFVDVVIENPAGSSTLISGYRYMAGPSAGGISPSLGPLSGGTTVTIVGTRLTGTTGVTFGGVASPNVTVVSPTQVDAVTPAGSAGAVNVVVTTPFGSSTASTQFTYAATPTLTNISPNVGDFLGDEVVTITGTNLATASGVTFGGTPGLILSASPTSLSVQTPSRAPGTVNVVVTTAAGTSNSVSFTFGF
jgi:hypothetical protein